MTLARRYRLHHTLPRGSTHSVVAVGILLVATVAVWWSGTVTVSLSVARQLGCLPFFVAQKVVLQTCVETSIQYYCLSHFCQTFFSCTRYFRGVKTRITTGGD